MSYDDLLDRLQAYLIIALQQASKLSNSLWLPLTAGYDSRLLLAAAHHAKIKVRTYTHIHKDMSDADRKLPSKLAKAVNLSHSAYVGKSFEEQLASQYDQHTGRHCVDRDRYYISHAYFDWCRKQDLILRGGCFEIGRCFYWTKFPTNSPSSRPPAAKEIVGGFKWHRPTSETQSSKAIEEWIEWSQRTPHEEMDWRDRFYWEQRLGGWLSSIEQSLDLINANRFYAANSHYFFSYILQIPVEKRGRSQHHIDLIERMAPSLLAFPFNPLPIKQRTLRWLKRKLIGGIKG
jgi:hypothetical protein